MSTRRVLVVVLVLVAVGVGWLSYVSASKTLSESRQRMENRFDLAGDISRTHAMIDPADRALTTRLISAAVRRASDDLGDTSDPVSAHMCEQLADEIAGLLSSRFGDRTDAYIDWRKTSGYRLASVSALKDEWFIDQTHEYLFGRKIPPDADPQSLYVTMAEGLDQSRGGRHRIVGIASDAGGLSAVLKVLTLTDPAWPALGGLVGELLDTGSHISTSKPWWRGGPDYRKKLMDQEHVLCAQVGFLAEFGDGARRPVSFSCVWDASRWWIHTAHVGASIDGGTDASSDAVRLEF